MSDAVILSNSQSAVLNSLYESDQSKIYDYSITCNTCNSSKEIVKIDPMSQPTTFHGSTVFFQIPRLGLMSKIVIEFVFTPGGAEPASSQMIAHRLFKSMALRTSNGEICRMTNFSLLGLISEMKFEDQLTHKRISSAHGDADQDLAANTQYTVQVEFINSFTARPQNWLDTNFVENLTVHVEMGTQIEANLVNALTGLQVYAYITYRQLELSARADYIKRMFGDGGDKKPVSMVTLTTFQESTKTMNGDTTITHDLKCSNPVVTTYFGAVRNVNASLNDTYLWPIKTVSFSCSGKQIYNNIPIDILDFENGKTFISTTSDGGSVKFVAFAKTSAGVKTIGTLTHGDRPDKLWDGQSGAIALGSLSNGRLSYVCPNAGANYRSNVAHLCIQLVSIDPQNGRIAIASAL